MNKEYKNSYGWAVTGIGLAGLGFIIVNTIDPNLAVFREGLAESFKATTISLLNPDTFRQYTLYCCVSTAFLVLMAGYINMRSQIK